MDEIDLRWGITRTEADEGKSLEICLREVDGARPFFLCFLGERYGWVPESLPAEEMYEFRGLQAETHLSITHLEILHAALQPLRSKGKTLAFPSTQAFFYFRMPNSLPVPEAVPESERPFFGQIYLEPLPERARQLHGLKEELRARFVNTGNIYDYSGTWDPFADNPEFDGFRGRLTDLSELGRRVESDLKRGIETVFAEHLASTGPPDATDEEHGFHETFVQTRLRAHVPRIPIERELTDYVRDAADRRPLLVYGPPGSGKSTLLARWSQSVADWPDWFAVFRFVGASPRSANLAQLLAELCQRIDRRFHLPEDIPDGQLLHETLRKWRRYLSAATDRNVLIVLDALDQLDDRADPAGAAGWIPNPLPPGVKLVVSVAEASPDRPGSRWLGAIRTIGPRELAVPGLTDDECRAIIHDVPSLVCKSLDSDQIERLLSNPSTRNPLFLRVVLDELRMFGSFEKLTAEIEGLPRGSAEAALDGLFGRVLDRLEREFGRILPGLVPRLFAWLSSAREGLTEPELMALLQEQYPAENPSLVSGALQVILRQLRVYLMMKSHPQGLLWDFYHRSFWASARKKTASDSAAIDGMARHFEAAPTRLPDGSWNLRKVSELPRLQCAVGRWTEFIAATTAPEWVAACAELGMASELAERLDEAHAAIRKGDPELASRLIARAASAVAPPDGVSHPIFNIDSVHSWLFIRPDQTYYDALLRAICGDDPCADRSALSAASYLAEQIRRVPEHSKAEELFARILPAIVGRGMWKEASRVQYGRGYIRYMTAASMEDLSAAAAHMDESVDWGDRAGDVVGAWIGRCLAAILRDCVGRLGPTWDQSGYRELMLRALEVFESEAASVNADPRAERWVRNAIAQLFDIAIDSGDTTSVELWRYRSLSNPWELRYGIEADRTLISARYARHCKNYGTAVTQYETHRDTMAARWDRKTEAAARLYFDYGVCLDEAGRRGAAVVAWQEGLSVSDEQGNFVWKEEIRRQLRR